MTTKQAKPTRRYYAAVSPQGFANEVWHYAFPTTEQRGRFVADNDGGRWEYSEQYGAMVCVTSESARAWPVKRAELTDLEAERAEYVDLDKTDEEQATERKAAARKRLLDAGLDPEVFLEDQRLYIDSDREIHEEFLIKSTDADLLMWADSWNAEAALPLKQKRAGRKPLPEGQRLDRYVVYVRQDVADWLDSLGQDGIRAMFDAHMAAQGGGGTTSR